MIYIYIYKYFRNELISCIFIFLLHLNVLYNNHLGQFITHNKFEDSSTLYHLFLNIFGMYVLLCHLYEIDTL